MNLAERLSEYVGSVRFRDLPQDVIAEAKKRVIDAFGCAIGAYDAEPVVAARNVAAAARANSATILGTRSRTTPDLASFVNGIMVRYFDFNDTYLAKEPGHPSDNIPACLAVAESEGLGGRDLLLAMVLAYEVQARLCDAADIRHRGWDHVCYGLVSASLAAGKLMGLSAEKMTQAVNIALNSHIAMRQVRAGELSDWKGCSFANAERNAVFSARLAREGMKGPSPIFEGEMGFFKQVSGPFDLDTEAFGGRGGKFKLLETCVKYFPAEYHAQSAIWAALELRKKMGDPRQVLAVEVDSNEAGYSILGKDPEKWMPATKETADHSLPYIVGMALLDGKIENSTYDGRKLRNPRTLEFLKKITVRDDPALTAMYPESIANRVTITLSPGRTISSQINDPKGHPKNPMTVGEIEAKFSGLTASYLSENQRREVLGRLWKLERERDLAGLARSLAVKKR